MFLLLVFCGGGLSICLSGCADSILHPFRPIYTDGGTGGTGDPDAGPDVEPVSCPTKLVGYGTLDGGTTGGGDGPTYTVDALAQLKMVASMPGPATIRISGTIAYPLDALQPVELESDKTVLPANVGDGLVNSGLVIKGKHNVIVRNLTIAKALAPWDAITIQQSSNVWVDHCDLSSDLVNPKGTYDGLVDITHGSGNVTISWNRFHDHYNTSLVGHTDTPAASDGDQDLALAVTFHHNLFLRTPIGSPRARFGHVHLFSNHYDTVELPSDPTSSYAIASTMGATLLIEGNVFEQVAVPIVTHLDKTPMDGTIADVNNLYDAPSSASANVLTTAPNNWKPPYQYADSVDSKESVPVIVNDCVGPGNVP